MLLGWRWCGWLPGFSVHLATQVDPCALSEGWALQSHVMQIPSGQSWKLWAGLLLPRSRESWYVTLKELRGRCAPDDKKAGVVWLLVSSCLEKQVYSPTLPHIQITELFPNWSSGSLYSCSSTKVTFLPFLFSCFFCLPTDYSFSHWAIDLCEGSIALWFPGATVRSPYWTGIKWHSWKVLSLLSLTFPWV